MWTAHRSMRGAAAAGGPAVRCCNGRLRLQIVDDGPGGAVEGAGLTGLQDRVRASFGQLTLASPQGNGTVLSVELSCV